MMLSEDDLQQVLEPVITMAFGPADSHDGSDDDGDGSVTGVSWITGDDEVLVEIACRGGSARSMTARMLQLTADEVSPSDVGDAIGELTNQVCGAVKSLLPGENSLNLPHVLFSGAPDGLDELTEVGGARIDRPGCHLQVRVHARLRTTV